MPIDTPEAMRSRVPPSTADERLAALPRVQIPGRHFDRRLRHVVAADRACSAGNTSRGCVERLCRARSGAMKPVMMCHTVSVVSAL